MNTRQQFVKRLFSIRNVVPFLIIVAAFVGTFTQAPFGIQRDQILLALLAFLAIDSLLERIEMLSSMEKDIKKVKDLVESQSYGKDMLKHRSDFPRLELMLAEVKQEIWITGITLDTMATLTELFQEKAKEGVKIRFLGVVPEGHSIEETARYCGFDQEEAAIRVRSNLYKLHARLAQNFPESVELRTIAHRLPQGYLVVDPHSDQGYMTVTPYFFQVQDSYLSPILFLSKRTDSHWFKSYLSDFDNLWNGATRWAPDKKDADLPDAPNTA